MIHHVMEGLFCKGVSIVEYYENNLSIEEYTSLRTSVGWNLLHNGQMNAAIRNSLYTVKVVHEKQAVAMGRLIGDGMYYLIADIIVRPEYQKCGIGGKVIDMILEYVRKNTPSGGRSSVQLIAEKGKEEFYIKKGFKTIPHEFCGSGMRKVIRN